MFDFQWNVLILVGDLDAPNDSILQGYQSKRWKKNGCTRTNFSTLPIGLAKRTAKKVISDDLFGSLKYDVTKNKMSIR